MGRDMMTAARLITCVGCDSQAVSRCSVASHYAPTHEAQYRAKEEEREEMQSEGLQWHSFAPQGVRQRGCSCLCKQAGPAYRRVSGRLL